ncbi:MAG TPA: PIG-L family deacetylase [Longimicrobium sp.]|nr:PIG-L family deacetylase [Longimicrobium sp.]
MVLRIAARALPRALLGLADEAAWDRGVVLIAAHPDDETIGAGGVMPRLPLLAVVHVTGGVPADRRWWGVAGQTDRAYGEARRGEAARALRLAGVRADRIRALGREDQRASFALEALARDVAVLLDELRPGVVLTHAYEGGHPDHDAAAFAVQGAGGLAAAPPTVLEFTGYHAWGVGIATARFLPAPAGDGASVPLGAADRARKQRMLGCFATQYATLAQFPAGAREHFRVSPGYDFTRPPHPGTLNYERFGWGITGPEWCALATAALRALGLRAGLPC